MPLTNEQMLASPWGSLGLPTLGGRQIEPAKWNYQLNRQEDRDGMQATDAGNTAASVNEFTSNGIKYVRGGAPWQSAYGGNNTQFFKGDPNTYGTYDPVHGYGLRADIAERIRGAVAQSNNEGLNKYGALLPLLVAGGIMAPVAFGGAAAAGGLEAGATGAFDMAGSAGLEGAFGIQPGVDAGMFSGAGAASGAGSLPDSYWNMLADSGTTATDVSSGMGNLTAGETAGTAAGGGADLVGGGSTLMGNATAGGGSWLRSLGSLLGGGGGGGLSGLSGLGSLLSGVSGIGQAIAANNAANTASNASNNATNAQLGIFNTINQQQLPYRQGGYAALGSMLGGMGLGPATGGVSANQFTRQFTPQDLHTNLAPNYAFMRDQGLMATTNQLNRLGGMASGNTLKGVNDYAMNFADNAYQNAFNNYNTQNTNIFNRLSNIAGLGQTANQSVANAGSGMAGGIGNTIVGAGQAQAAGQVGVASALSNAANSAMGWYSLPQLLAYSGSANG